MLVGHHHPSIPSTCTKLNDADHKRAGRAGTRLTNLEVVNTVGQQCVPYGVHKRIRYGRVLPDGQLQPSGIHFEKRVRKLRLEPACVTAPQ